MKFIQKPSPPFEAFQWFKPGDGPDGVVKLWDLHKLNCKSCLTKLASVHGALELNNRRTIVCPGNWVAEIMTAGKWEKFTPAAFEDFCVPVVDVEKWMLEGLEKLGFSGLKSENPENPI